MKTIEFVPNKNKSFIVQKNGKIRHAYYSNKYLRVCAVCLEKFLGRKNSKVCSFICRKINKNNLNKSGRIRKKILMFPN